MRKRTPSEIKAYCDGYCEAYGQFCHLLNKNDKDKAIRKMEIFAKVVEIAVETATDEADTPQTERGRVMGIESNKEAYQMVKNTLGSIENRFREAYNKGYKDGLRDGADQVTAKLVSKILEEVDEERSE